MQLETIPTDESPFEKIKHVDENGKEFWNARRLMPLLGYEKWPEFFEVLEQTLIKLRQEGTGTLGYVRHSENLVKSERSGRYRYYDLRLSKDMCYEVAKNSDSIKTEVILAQEYFRPSDDSVQLEKIRFQNEDIVLLEHEGRRLVGLKSAVENLGLNWKRQHKTITADPVLQKGIASIGYTSKGGVQKTLFIEFKFFLLYLGKINSKKVKEEIRPKLEAYQVELAEMIENHFFRKFEQTRQSGLPYTLEQIREMEEKIEDYDEQMCFSPLKNHPHMLQKVQDKINELKWTLGRHRKNPDYNKAIREQLCNYFSVTSVSNIPRISFEDVMGILDDWISYDNNKPLKLSLPRLVAAYRQEMAEKAA